MPFRAVAGTEEVVSIDLPAAAFDALRGRRDLRMVCCEASAVAKRSVRGLPFFAHGKRGECSTADETAFHLHGKAIIARAAREAGWTADIEAAAEMPAGERWRADVLCTRGNVRLAFEVQRSGITLATLHERQQRYRASGVRCLWFMRTHERALARAQPWQDATPALYLTEQHHVPGLDLSLDATVQAALGGHLILFPRPGHAVQVTVILESQCWLCRGACGVLTAVLVSPPGFPELAVVVPGTTPDLAGWVRGLLPLDDPSGPQHVVEWPTTTHRMCVCPGCRRPFGMGVFRPDVTSWVRRAQGLSGEAGERVRSFRQGQQWVMQVTTVLSEEQHGWVSETVGRRWVLRSVTE